MKIKEQSRIHIEQGLSQLPFLPDCQGKNGEVVITDEAEVWKRVLQYRIAQWLKPKKVLETHKGLGIGTQYMKDASPDSLFFAPNRWQDYGQYAGMKFELIDIDPFGFSYDILRVYKDKLKEDGVLMLTNGEALSVSRNLPNVKFKSKYKGRDLPLWAKEEYLPRIEELSGLEVQFWYLFPTTIRTILSNLPMPEQLFTSCPQLMRYSNL